MAVADRPLVVGSRGQFPYHEGRHLLVGLKQFALVDESGIHTEAEVCLVGGYRASPVQWKRFNANWSGVLGRYNIRVFHSNVFFNRKRIRNPKKNPYLKWTDAKANDFLGELLSVIHGQRIHPIGGSVKVPDFQSFPFHVRCDLAGYSSGPSRRKHRQPAPYHFAFKVMIGDALKGTHPDTAMHFIAAEQREYEQRASEVHARLKNLQGVDQSRQLRGIAFEAPCDFPGLQAADLFAWHWHACADQDLPGEDA